jgi:hypothetical protein
MTWDYLAGLFDGEGSICMAGGKCNRQHLVYRVNFTVSNNHEGVLRQARAFIGMGSVVSRTRPSPLHRQSWVLSVSGYRLLPILKRLAPRTIIKRPQLALAVAYIERRKRLRTRPYDEVDYDMVREMRRLNNRAPGKGRPLRDLPSGVTSA